ncbi:MAG: hypothetical protein QW734_07075 [Candidatus Bathyarchaeia archaeon]
MAKKAIASKVMDRRRYFLRTRKPGKFSPKSKLLWVQAGPKFKELTPQQKRIAEVGKICGREIRGKYPGKENVKARRAAMAQCVLREFAKLKEVVS